VARPRGGMRTRAACDTPGRMNLEYVWWILALILAGGGVLAFLAFGRVPEIEDEDETAEGPPDAADLDGVRSGPAG
jgi:hypothetical protein